MDLRIDIQEANSLYEAIEDRLAKLGAVPSNIEDENEVDRLLKLRYKIGLLISEYRRKNS